MPSAKLVIVCNHTPTPEELKQVGDLIKKGKKVVVDQPPGISWQFFLKKQPKRRLKDNIGG